MSEPLLLLANVLDQVVSMRRGTSREIVIPVTDENGTPIDLTNATARWWVGKSVNSTGADIIIEKTTGGGGGITITQVNGIWQLNIAVLPADTETDQPRLSYYHEAEVTDQASNVYVVASGTYQLLPALTT